jgi:hypothetical protein
MIFRLVEEYLMEDIAAVKKQYSHIPENDFDRIIRLDPTFDENRDSVGKYGKWLLGLYKKDNPLNSDVNITKMLSVYDNTVKDRTKQIEKDTGKFKSLDDMQNAIENAGEAELSDRQKLRQKQANKDYDLVYQNEDWAVFVPNTWEADVNLGKGTSWCTADSREESGKKYFDHYLNEYGGKYYVIINKHDKSDKYQFHFESSQFMDKNDRNINVKEFCDNNDLSKFFEKEMHFVNDEVVEEIMYHLYPLDELIGSELFSLKSLFPDVFRTIYKLNKWAKGIYYLEDICEDKELFMKCLLNIAPTCDIKISKLIDEDSIYLGTINAVDFVTSMNIKLEYFLPTTPLKGTNKIYIYDNQFYLKADENLLRNYIKKCVDNGANNFYQVLELTKSNLIKYANTENDCGIGSKFAIKFVGTTNFDNLQLNFSWENVFIALILYCLRSNYEEFCNQFSSYLVQSKIADSHIDALNLTHEIFKRGVD